MSKYADIIKAQFIKNFEERAQAYEATKHERDQLFGEFLNPRVCVSDKTLLIVRNKNKAPDK